MKKIFLLGLSAILFFNCEKPKERYFVESPEITDFKANISEYSNGDWESWRAHFADTAKLYVNSLKSISVSDLENNQKEMLSNFSSYGFQEKGSFVEMVLDNQDKTWVNYWANWHGTLKANSKEIDVPVHITAQYVDGKIAEIYDYFDTSPINTALNEIEDYNAMSMDEKTLTNTINTMVAVWNKNDQDAMKSITVPNLIRNSNGTREVNNQEEYGAIMSNFFTGFPDFKVILENSEIKDNKAIITWRCVGTNTGEFLGNAPTNKKVNVLGMSVWTFNAEGKATQEDAFFDNQIMFNQLGITPPKA